MAPDPPLLLQDHLDRITLPVIVARLDTLINGPACSAADIAEIINQDASLSARVLKIVNSPFCGVSSQIDSISMAITFIGTHALRDIIMTMALIRQFNRFPEGLITPQQFWRHSLAVAPPEPRANDCGSLTPNACLSPACCISSVCPGQ